MSLVFCTTDLMFSSRVSVAAKRLARRVDVVSSPDALVAHVSDPAVTLAIVDLSLPGLNVAELVSRLRQARGAGLRVVAFAPHVHESKLGAARHAGCDMVLSKGQFDRQVEQLLSAEASGMP